LFSNWTGPGGRVVAIEPNPSNASIIKTNVDINHLDNIEILNVAVGEEKGRLNLSIKNSNSFLTKEKGPLTIPVEVITLDSLSDIRPDFIKLDVEGADVLALRGAKNILKSYPKIAIEVHKDSLTSFSTTLDELLSLVDFDAYDCWIQWNYESNIGRWQFENYDIMLADGEKMVTGTHIFAKPRITSTRNQSS
jgi:FkbM family methyltransferase